MAVSTNINPWSGGAVVFNQQPYLQFYEQQMLRKQAKQDALENYFRDLNKNLTSSGMRSQDVPSLLKKQQDAQQFYFQNKSNILNPKLDNGAAYTEYQARHQDMLGLIDQSKEAAKAMSEIGKAKLNPQTSYMFEDPTFMDQVKAHELPIGDPNRRGINLATLLVPDKPKTTKDWEDLNKYATGGIPYDKVPGEAKSIGNFKISTPIYSQYSPENQKLIGQHYANAYDTERGWRSEAVKTFNEIQHDPIQFQKYNETYKSLFGKDIDNPKDAWIAKGILDNNRKATEFIESEDVFGREKAMQAIRNADEQGLIRLRKQLNPNDIELNNAWIDQYLNNRIETAKSDAANKRFVNTPHTSKPAYEISGDPVLSKALSRGKSEPDRIYVTEDNKIWPIFYKYGPARDTKGNLIKGGGTVVLKNEKGDPYIDEDYSKPLESDQAKLALGYKGETKKQLARTMTGGVPATQVNQNIQKPKETKSSFTIDGKTYTRKQLIDMGYTDDEIVDFLSKGIIK